MTGAVQALGSSATSWRLSGGTITGSAGGVGTCTLIIRSDGTVDKEENSVITQIDSATDWIRPAYLGALNYEVRFTQNSGSVPETGTLNSWLSCASDQAVGYTSAPRSGQFLVEVRTADTQITVASGTYDLETS